MAMVMVVSDSRLQVGSMVQVSWLGLRVGSRLALLCIQHMNWVNSGNDEAMTTASSTTLSLV